MKTNLLLSLLAIAITGCATLSDPKVQSSIASAATRLAINQFVDTEDRKEVSNWLYYVASVVRSLSGGEAPSVESFNGAISQFTPDSKQWAGLASALSDLYADFYPSIKGDWKAALEVLEALATGCERAAKSMSE